jgi:hypothetical protein
MHLAMGAQPARSHSLGELGDVRVSQARGQQGWGSRPENRFGAICGYHACDQWLSWPRELGLEGVGIEQLARSVWGILEKLWKALMYARCAGKVSRQPERPDWRCPNLARPYGLTFSLAVDHCVTQETVLLHHRATAGTMEGVRVAQRVGSIEREERVSQVGGEVGLCPMIALTLPRESSERSLCQFFGHASPEAIGHLSKG